MVRLQCAQVRVPTHIVSTICDDRGEEPTYAGVTMSTLMEGDFCVGDVISLLWFKRQLPKYATRFIEMCVMLCADHGPCVSGVNPSLHLPSVSRNPAGFSHALSPNLCSRICSIYCKAKVHPLLTCNFVFCDHFE